jgi:hypothetical protein
LFSDLILQIPGFEHASMEHATEDGLMCMDIAVPAVSLKNEQKRGLDGKSAGSGESARPDEDNKTDAGETAPVKRKRGRPPGTSSSKAKSIGVQAEAGVAFAEPLQNPLNQQLQDVQMASPGKGDSQELLLGAVPFKGIAIEVDGPTHFLNSHPDTSDGTSQVLDSVLQVQVFPRKGVFLPPWTTLGIM